MKINVTHIPPEGFEIDFSDKDAWLQQKLNRSLKSLHHAEDPVQGHFSVSRIMNNVEVRANMHLPIHATCDRCAQDYRYEMDVRTDRLMTPLYDSKRQKEHEKSMDIEVTADDMQFSYFKGDEIDLGDIIVEQAALDLPMNYLCQKKCKGLCINCGVNLNENACKCKVDPVSISPFAALKDWDKKK